MTNALISPLRFTFIGQLSADILSSITQLVQEHASLLQLQQLSLSQEQGLCSLVILPSEDDNALNDAISAYANQIGLTLHQHPATNSSVAYQLTLLAKTIDSTHVQAVDGLLAEHNVAVGDIKWLSDAECNTDTDYVSAMRWELGGTTVDLAVLREAITEISNQHGVDIAVEPEALSRRNRRLVCFDMDSTLIDAEVIDELAKEAGVGEQVVAITEAAMRGEIDFNESFAKRMALLEGLSESVLETIAGRLQLTDGAEKLLSYLNKMGYTTAILSGGFDYFARHLQQRLNIDYIHANQLDIVDGVVTGKVVGTVVNGQRKAELLQEIAAKHNVELDQVVAVGDGANDLPMLGLAGLGVAFRAKPLVRASAEYSIHHLGLDAILYLLECKGSDFA